jgi:hypothetical protein
LRGFEGFMGGKIAFFPPIHLNLPNQVKKRAAFKNAAPEVDYN